MGASIVKHLLKADFEVIIYTRTKSKAEPLVELGAKWANTVGQATKEAEVIFTMIGTPQDVEEVYLGEEGIFANGHAGQIVVDMTTSSPALAKKLAQRGKKLGIESIDAPVSGGDIGAQNGTLSIMCGGEEAVFDRLKPLFAHFGSQVVYQGQAGAGQHTKMCNQLAIATNMIGICEALAYGKKAGLNLDTVLASIESGAAGSWSLSNLSPRIIKGDYEPGFYIRHFVKDLSIALEEAKAMELPLPGLELALSMYKDLVEQGYGDNGTQALYKLYE